MPTQVTAVLDLATLEQLLGELTPLSVRLGDQGGPNRYFTIDRPTLLEFIPGRGLRIRTSAHAHWTLAGVPIPLTIESATLVLEPSLAPPPAAGKLLFTLKLEELEVKNVPNMIEATLMPLINEGLAVLEGPLGWDFAKTLGVKIPIPPKAAPLESFTLSAGSSSVEVTSEAIVMKLALQMHFVHVGAKVVEEPRVPHSDAPADAKSSEAKSDGDAGPKADGAKKPPSLKPGAAT